LTDREKNLKPGFEPLSLKSRPDDDGLEAVTAFHARMKTRRSVREFSDRPVDRRVIEKALAVAGTAPSGANMQPWCFVAVSNPELKRRIREAAEEEEREFYAHRASQEWLDALKHLGTDENKPFLETAPWLIVVFLKKFTRADDGRKLKNYYTAESVGLACGFLLTALHTAGLATLTHTPSPMRFLNELLDRPRDERAYMIIVTGHPAKDATVPVIEKYGLDEFTQFRE